MVWGGKNELNGHEMRSVVVGVGVDEGADFLGVEEAGFAHFDPGKSDAVGSGVLYGDFRERMDVSHVNTGTEYEIVAVGFGG